LRLQEAAGLRRVQLSLLRPCGAPDLQRHTPVEGVLAVAGSVELDERLTAVVRGEVRIRLLRSTERVCTREVRPFDLRELRDAFAKRIRRAGRCKRLCEWRHAHLCA